MSNKTTLQSHNTQLQELIDKANALPNASGGLVSWSPEACRVQFVINGGFVYYLYYTSGTTFEAISETRHSSNNTKSITVQKNTIVVLVGVTASGDSMIFCENGYAAFSVTEDCEITLRRYD